MSRLNIKKEFKPNIKEYRLKGYILDSEYKIQQLEQQLALQNKLLKKILSKHERNEE